jgi:hypothetical protein
MRKPARGRPLKFGRPAQLVALTLPHDVVRGLRGMHPDPAWAIVSLVQKAGRGEAPSPSGTKRVAFELAQLSGRRALIVVDPTIYRRLPGVSVIPMAPRRAFLALEAGRGIADLELAVLDRIEHPGIDGRERKELVALRRQLRSWRRSRHLCFSTRSIILVEQAKDPRRTAVLRLS